MFGTKVESLLNQTKHSPADLSSALVVLGVFAEHVLLGSAQFIPGMGTVVGFHTCEKFLEPFGLDQSWLSQVLSLSHSFC